MVQNRARKQDIRHLARRENISYQQAEAMERAISTPILIDEEGGNQVMLVLEPSWNPYGPVDNPVYAQIQLADGTLIYSMDQGTPVHNLHLIDGVVSDEWVHPQTPDGNPAGSLMTVRQYELLVMGDDVASSYFADDLADRLGIDVEAQASLTLPELHKLVGEDGPTSFQATKEAADGQK